MTFQVARDGVVRERNLGADTTTLARALPPGAHDGWTTTVD